MIEQLRAGALDVAVVVEPPTYDPNLESGGRCRGALVSRGQDGTSVGRRPTGVRGCCFRWGSHTGPTTSGSCRELMEHRWTGGGRVPPPEVLREIARLGVGWTVLPEAQDTGRGGRSRRKGLGPGAKTRRLVVARPLGGSKNPAAIAWSESLGAESDR